MSLQVSLNNRALADLQQAREKQGNPSRMLIKTISSDRREMTDAIGLNGSLVFQRVSKTSTNDSRT